MLQQNKCCHCFKSPWFMVVVYTTMIIGVYIQGTLHFNSVAQSCPTLCDPMNHSTPGLPVCHQLPEFSQTHAHWVSDAIQSSHPLSSLLLLPPIPPSIKVFSNESTRHMRWPKYWSFSFKYYITLHHMEKTQINFLANPILPFDKSITVTNIYIYKYK